MANEKTVLVVGGVGVPFMLFMVFLVFLVLKLCGTIAWSWWWVTAPLWIPAGVLICVIVVSVLIYTLIKTCSSSKRQSRN